MSSQYYGNDGDHVTLCSDNRLRELLRVEKAFKLLHAEMREIEKLSLWNGGVGIAEKAGICLSDVDKFLAGEQ